MRLLQILFFILISCQLVLANGEVLQSNGETLVDGFVPASETIDSHENAFAKGIFWINLKPKVERYLEKAINKNAYIYKIIGPAKEMQTFLGNRPDAVVKFEGLNLGAPSSRKSLVAYVLDDSGKQRVDTLVVYLDVKIYKKVLTLKKGLASGQEVSADNIVEKTIVINQGEAKLYYQGTLVQQVAAVNIAAGQPIKVNMIRHQKLIQAGERIKVRNNGTAVRVEFFCKSINSGDIGEVVNLFCPELEKKNHRAKIIEDGVAELI